MKTLPTHPSAQAAFTPVLEKPKHRSQPLCYGNSDTFFTQCCRYHPHLPPTHILALHPSMACRCHVLQKIMSWEPCFSLLLSTLTWV